jgi:hypothetical protein
MIYSIKEEKFLISNLFKINYLLKYNNNNVN